MTRPADHRLAQTPARFDHPLVRAGDRVAREHHSAVSGWSSDCTTTPTLGLANTPSRLR